MTQVCSTYRRSRRDVHCSPGVAISIHGVALPLEYVVVEDGPVSLVVVLVGPESNVHAVLVQEFLHSIQVEHWKAHSKIKAFQCVCMRR